MDIRRSLKAESPRKKKRNWVIKPSQSVTVPRISASLQDENGCYISWHIIASQGLHKGNWAFKGFFKVSKLDAEQ